ncbi:MAG: hypothetical protein R3B49_00710 [Phycisphaerales bacterium]
MKGMIRMLVLPLAAVAMVLGGCGKDPHVGSWTLDKVAFETQVRQAMKDQMASQAGGDDQAAAAAAMMAGLMDSMVTKMVENTNLSMDIKADGTFHVSGTMGGEAPEDSDGTWKASGGTITMNIKDKPPATGNIRDGSLYLKMPEGGDGPAVELKFDRKKK